MESLTAHLVLFKTLFVKNYHYFKRYLFNNITSMLSMYIMFLFLFLAIEIASPAFLIYGDAIENIVVAYFMWITAMAAITAPSWDLMEEANTGTLEQLSIQPFGLGMASAMNALSSFILNLFVTVIVLIMMMITTGRWLHVDAASLIPIFIFSWASVYGVGLMFGGLALIFKRVAGIFNFIQWFMLGCIFVAYAPGRWAIILPFSLGTRLAGEVMVNGTSIINLPISSIILLILNGVIYFIIGYFIFMKAVKIAKIKGTLGHY